MEEKRRNKSITVGILIITVLVVISILFIVYAKLSRVTNQEPVDLAYALDVANEEYIRLSNDDNVDSKEITADLLRQYLKEKGINLDGYDISINEEGTITIKKKDLNTQKVEIITPKLVSCTGIVDYGTSPYAPPTPVKIVVSYNTIASVDGYSIYRATTNEGKYVFIGESKTNEYSDKTANSFSIDTNYYYKVRAYKEINGEIVYSDLSEAKGVAFSPTTPAIGVDSVGNGMKISWKKLAGQERYEVWRGVNSAKNTKVIVDIDTVEYMADSGMIEFTDKTVSLDVEYYYSIRAYRMIDGIKIYSRFSEIQKISKKQNGTTEVDRVEEAYNIQTPTIYANGYVDYGTSPYAPPKPSKIQITINQIAGADGYEIYTVNTKGGYLLVGKTKTDRYDDERSSIFSIDENYYYKARAYKVVNGKTIYSEFSEVKGAGFSPTTPAFAIDSVGNGIRISWKKLAGQERYEVWRGIGSSRNAKIIADINTVEYMADSGMIEFTDKIVDLNVEYYYSIRAYRVVDGRKIYSNNDYTMAKY